MKTVGIFREVATLILMRCQDCERVATVTFTLEDLTKLIAKRHFCILLG